MLSLPLVSPRLNLYQSQRPFQQPQQRKGTGKNHGLNFPSFPENLPFLTSSRLLSATSVNAYDSNNGVSCNTSYVEHHIDPAAIGHWLQSCSRIEDIRKLHAVIVKCMSDPLVFVSNNLISVYVRFGDLIAARQVFDSMIERNVVSWTAMVNGYQRYGTGNEVLRLFSEFVNCGVRGNAQTYVCMLNFCSETFDYKLGKQLHACIIKSQVSNLILDCAVLHFYAQCSDLDGAFHVFDRMHKRDVISWTTMITACSQHKRGNDAFIMFGQMISDGVGPNEFTVCSMLTVCGEEEHLRFGEQLHGTIIKKAYDKDVYIGTSLMDMYAKCGKIIEARTLFDRMKRRNAITWTTIIAGYARNGLGEEAIRFFRLMIRLKVLASSLTMVCILRACGLLRALSTGKEVHAQILKKFTPENNIFIGSALVWLYCKCGNYTSASKVLQYLPDRDVVSWTAMISGCARIGHEYEALEYLKEMLGEGVEPNPFTYSSALKACAKLENVTHGRLIHSSINKSPALSNVFVGSALVHMYSKCGYLLEAVKVFDSMPERNLVSWKAIIVAYAKNGHCGDALKLMYRMQAEGIAVDDYILSTVLTACGDFKWNIDDSSSENFADLKKVP